MSGASDVSTNADADIRASDNLLANTNASNVDIPIGSPDIPAKSASSLPLNVSASLEELFPTSASNATTTGHYPVDIVMSGLKMQKVREGPKSYSTPRDGNPCVGCVAKVKLYIQLTSNLDVVENAYFRKNSASSSAVSTSTETNANNDASSTTDSTAADTTSSVSTSPVSLECVSKLEFSANSVNVVDANGVSLLCDSKDKVVSIDLDDPFLPNGLEMGLMSMKKGEISRFSVSKQNAFASSDNLPSFLLQSDIFSIAHDKQSAKTIANSALLATIELIDFTNVGTSWWEKSSFDDKYAEGVRRKSTGNSYYKVKNFTRATLLYQSSLEVANTLYEFRDSITPEQARLRQELLVQNLGNLCSTWLDQDLPNLRAVAHNCDLILQFDPTNEKALFRRAKARLGEDDEAVIEDIAKLKVVCKDSKMLARADQVYRAASLNLKKQRERERKMFANVLEKAAAEPDEVPTSISRSPSTDSVSSKSADKKNDQGSSPSNAGSSGASKKKKKPVQSQSLKTAVEPSFLDTLKSYLPVVGCVAVGAALVFGYSKLTSAKKRER
jgi:hypothetical protein